MLAFDLRQTPPSKGDIEAERLHLERELAKNKRRRTLMTVFFFLIPMAVIVASWQFGFVDGKTVVIIAAAVSAVVGVVVAVGADAVDAVGVGVVAVFGSLYNCKTNLEARLASLSGLDKEDYMYRCPAILESCRQDASCETYRANVAKLGRALTAAEADMIEAWVVGADARDKETERQRQQQDACMMLKSTGSVS